MSSTMLERRVGLWRDSADQAEVALGFALSCAISAETDTVRALAESVWGIVDDFEFHDANESLMRRAFVQEIDRGIRILTPLRTEIQLQFEREDPERFLSVFARLAELEASSGVVEPPAAAWSTEARIAYYLAPIDAHGSASRLTAAFVSPPVDEVTAARQWVADLAVAQERFLSDGHLRELTFFRAFRAYQSGDRQAAIAGFRAVLSTGDGVRDRVGAIAAHLHAVMQPYATNAESLVEESIAVSRQLGLTENLVMAQNTLAGRLLRKRDFTRAAQVAEDALAVARTSGSPYLLCFTSVTHIDATWLSLTNDRTTQGPPALADRYVGDLLRLAREYRSLGDFGGSIHAVNSAAGILRDSGRSAEALSLVEDEAPHFGVYADPAELKRIAQTVGSLLRDLAADERSRAHRLLALVDQLKDPDQSWE